MDWILQICEYASRQFSVLRSGSTQMQKIYEFVFGNTKDIMMLNNYIYIQDEDFFSFLKITSIFVHILQTLDPDPHFRMQIRNPSVFHSLAFRQQLYKSRNLPTYYYRGFNWLLREKRLMETYFSSISFLLFPPISICLIYHVLQLSSHAGTDSLP